ncbi:MAG: Spy/CpxP family protein refolding chaperone [Desulfuromonadaceae bacterium]|nr:Spy/CpxP family protein refolding chaperone [Desulfuromonadaceae bacterium]
MSRNRNNMAKVVVSFCFAALTALAGIAQADGVGNGEELGGRAQQHNLKILAKKLGLTDAQKLQTMAIFQSNKDVIKPIITSLRTERENLHALLHADSVDEAAIRAEKSKMALIEADLNVNRAKIGVQLRTILAPEQLAILKTLQEQRQHKDNKTRLEEWL